MPHLPTFGSHANDDVLQEMVPEDLPPKRRPSLLRKPKEWLRRHRGHSNGPLSPPATAPTDFANIPDYFITRRPSLPEVASAKRAIPSLPRPQTFRRQQSEQREKLLEVEPTPNERRTLSADRRRSRGLSASGPRRPLSPLAAPLPSISAPSIANTNDDKTISSEHDTPASTAPSKHSPKELPPLSIPDAIHDPLPEQDGDDNQSLIEKSSLQEAFEKHWILNLSMHFRDKSNREKFFVTYAEKPNQWRRITISLDYRDAPADSLEAELSSLVFQRDKSIRIYEAIRDSLPDIQYYDTVTNFKLETTKDDGQLHVHVREDANEIVQFPALSLFRHIRCPRFNESSLQFDSHLSGFVYKVHLDNRILIKKEIPGPDTVDEFLYEVNALDSLLGSPNVIQLEGLVTDDKGELVKGLLLSYASQGALVDMIYDFRDRPELGWPRREKWAKQIVAGLADIHEAGFVQGDFTLSNVVIDEDDNAQIIDINRRGCPVGWESPELGRLINSGQRIGMCIGVKTDLFQLGMVLWALAEQVDEPERVERPLPDVTDEAPRYLQDVIRICLSDRPQGRQSARELLRHFPPQSGYSRQPRRSSLDCSRDLRTSEHSEPNSHRSAKEYIDPNLAVTIDEVKDRRRSPPRMVTYLKPDSAGDSAPGSSMYRFESSGSWVVPRRRTSRGRSPVSSRRRRSSPYAGRTSSSATSLSEVSPSRRPDDETWDTCGTSKERGRSISNSRAPELQGRRISPPTNKRLTTLQGQNSGMVAELVHTDSGFDEAMDDLDLDASNLTETPRIRRVRTYVSDDDDDDLEEVDGQAVASYKMTPASSADVETIDDSRQEGTCMPE